MSFLKVGVSQFLKINLILIILILGCSKQINANKLVFNKCLITKNEIPFSGNFISIKGNKKIIGKVVKGKLLSEMQYLNDNLITIKTFSNCQIGYQIFYDENKNILSEGNFKENKRVGIWKTYLKDSIHSVMY